MQGEHHPAIRTLTHEDVLLLLSDRSVRVQMEVVTKLVEQYATEGQSALSAREATIAHDIFRLLMARADVVVRAMLTMHLSQVEGIPADLALLMAMDTHDDVACPMLRYSSALQEEHLLRIIGGMADSPKLLAIAQREHVSEPVSDMLVNTFITPVISALVKNEGAQIGAHGYQDIIRHYASDLAVMEALLQRTATPLPVLEHATTALAAPVRKALEALYGDVVQISARKRKLTQQMEQGAIRIMGFRTEDAGLAALMRQLEKLNLLPMISALGMCDLEMFCVCMSRKLRLPIQNVRILLSDDKGYGMVYDKSGLPLIWREPVRLAVRALQAMAEEKKTAGVTHTPGVPEVIARMRTLSHGRKVDGLDWLLAMMMHYN